jgi:broad specificity phosphatase PhoE
VLVLVRHGRTADNAAGLLLGRADVPLDDVGEAQAKAVAAALSAGGPPRRVVSSPLLRARQTAAAFGVPVEVDERWVELDYGEWDRRPITAIPREEWAAWRADPAFAPPGGESLLALAARVGQACAGVADDAGAGDIVVVSHVSPIKAAVAWSVGAGVELAWRLHLDVASVTRVAFGPAGPVLRSFNERVPR